MTRQNKIIILIAVLIALGVVAFAADTIYVNAHRNPNLYDAFAQCLTEKGAVMYGASWCPHCQENKAALMNAVQYVKYVECPDNTQLCLEKDIQGYPTWIIGTSTRIEGFDKSTLEQLSAATGCPLPQN